MNDKQQLPIVEGDFQEWPDFWFQKLVRSVRDGDFGSADRAQRELDRLGWEVKPKKRVPA